MLGYRLRCILWVHLAEGGGGGGRGSTCPLSGMVVSNCWTGLLDWTTGLDYWTGLLDSHLTKSHFPVQL